MDGGWAAGATVVILDASAIQISLPTDLRGVPRWYRVGPATQAVDHSSFVSFQHTATGAGLKPFAPVRMSAVPDGAGGYNVSWLRRTRVDGDNWSLSDVPLGETYEAYRVQIAVGGNVVRTVDVPTSNWTYDAAAFGEDGAPANFEIEVAQISDLYGPGDRTRIVIND